MTNEQLLNRLNEDIRLRALSEYTHKTYTRNVRKFLEFCGNRNAETLDEKDGRAFLLHLMDENKISNVTINLYNTAIRFFFAVTLNRPVNYLQMPMTKRGTKLPELLTREEIHRRLVDECENLKHKSWFLLAYGSGLRVSEIAALKVADIDSQSMRVFVRGGKGKKDRYTILSKACLQVLRKYWLEYRPKHPQNWLFPGVFPDGVESPDHIKIDAIERAFNRTVERIGVAKDVTIHTLRHCFATHLLEDGASVFQIKELMGHATLRSTQRYIHLANSTTGLTSPADRR